VTEVDALEWVAGLPDRERELVEIFGPDARIVEPHDPGRLLERVEGVGVAVELWEPGEVTESLLEAALGYARIGWRVFPCHSPNGQRCSCGKPLGRDEGECAAKHPRTLNGWKDATTDEAQILKWWGMWPDASIGSPTPAVLDVEARKSDDEPDGLAEFQKLIGRPRF
jgi:hypothetical protein